MDLLRYPRHDPRLTPVLAELELLNGAGEPTASAVGCGEPVDVPPRVQGTSRNFESQLRHHHLKCPWACRCSSCRRAPSLACGIERQPAAKWCVTSRSLPLVPGDYLLTLGCSTNDRQLDLLEQVAGFNVEPRDFFRSGFSHQLNGQVLMRSSWDLTGASAEAVAAVR